MIENYKRFFVSALKGKSGRIGSFRSKYTKRQESTINKKISKQQKALQDIGYGFPIFSIGGFNFSIGNNNNPAWDLESIPTDLNPGRTYVYFNIPSSQGGDKPKTLDDVKEFLDLKPRGVGRIDIIYKRQSKSSAKEVASSRTGWKIMSAEERIRAVNKEVAKKKYPYRFKTSELINFIDQIQYTHPVVAIALIKVYFGNTPGSAADCPDIMEISRISKKDKITDKKSLALLRRYIKPIEKFKTKTGKSFYPFQLTGIAFWKAAGGRVLFGDQMGIGKTMQAVGAIRLAAVSKDMKTPFPVIIIAPRSTLFQWEEAFQEWIPETKPIVATGKILKKLLSKTLTKQAIVITTYASMTNELGGILSKKFQFAVFDESQNIKNPRAFRTQAAIIIGHKAKYVALLSGSPEEKGLDDLWAQFHIIAPRRFPTLNMFEKSMETIAYNPQTKKLGEIMPHNTSLYDGKKVLMQRYKIGRNNEYIVEPYGLGETTTGGLYQPLQCFMIRRLKSEVLKQLPPKIRNIVCEELSPKSKEYYEKLVDEVSKRLASKRTQKWADIIVKLTKELMSKGMSFSRALAEAKQSSKAKDMLENISAKTNALVEYSELKKQMGILKVPLVLNWVQKFVKENPNEGLLIFAEQHQVVNSLASGISKMKNKNGRQIRVATYTGLTSNDNRRRIQKQFQDGKIDILILNLAGNTGLNLQRASYVLFAERYWNPGWEEQAEDRAHRNGKKGTVNVYYMTIKGWERKGNTDIITIDEKIQDLIDNKRIKITSHIGNQEYETKFLKSKAFTQKMFGALNDKFSKFNKRDQHHVLAQTLKREGLIK